MSVLEEYELGIKRNPFKINKQNKFISIEKNQRERTFSKKEKVLIAYSSQLRTFYNLPKETYSRRLSLIQIQTPKTTSRKNYNCEQQSSEYYKQQVADSFQTQSQKLSFRDKKISSISSKKYSMIIEKPKNQKSLTKKTVEFSFKQIEPKIEKQKSITIISKPTKRTSQKESEKAIAFNNLLQNFQQLKQYGIGMNQNEIKRNLSFTFGKCF